MMHIQTTPVLFFFLKVENHTTRPKQPEPASQQTYSCIESLNKHKA